MKTLKLILLLFITSSASAQDSIPKGPIIEFLNPVFDYGTIEYNGDGRCVFVFKNTGNQPMIISNAKSSCGCLVASWPTEPIMPGESAEIKAKYYTRRVGPINKSITVNSNAVNSPRVILRITGTVKPRPIEESPTNNSNN